jgi:hypothetical protein
VICDGVGTHIGFAVLQTAVELGLEVVPRVSPLSSRVQGEDTVNFSALKVKSLPLHIAKIVFVSFNICTSLTCYCMAHEGNMEKRQARDASGNQHQRERQHALTTSTPQVQTLRTVVSNKYRIRISCR